MDISRYKYVLPCNWDHLGALLYPRAWDDCHMLMFFFFRWDSHGKIINHMTCLEDPGDTAATNFIELDDGKIYTGKPNQFDGVKTCKNHGFRLKFSQQNQSIGKFVARRGSKGRKATHRRTADFFCG